MSINNNFHTERHIAFTLAEVLITLGIIGVVAAMTLPTLIAKYKERVWVASAKKAYSVFANAIQRYNVDHGVIGDNSFLFSSGKSDYEIGEALAEYLNVVEKCPYAYYDNSCGGAYDIYFSSPSSTYSNGTLAKSYIGANPSRFVLNNGMIFWVINENTTESGCYFKWDNNTRTSFRCGRIVFDTNGTKGPNKIGADVFAIWVYPNFIYSPNDTGTGGLDTVMVGDKTIPLVDYVDGEPYKQ